MFRHENTPQYCIKAAIYRLFRRLTPLSIEKASYLRRMGPAVANRRSVTMCVQVRPASQVWTQKKTLRSSRTHAMARIGPQKEQPFGLGRS
jgi:hypothetical protein